MKRALALVLAVLSVSAAVAVAAKPKAAAPNTGTFKAAKGEVQRGYDLQFKVNRTGTRITKLVAHVLETCDGSSYSSTTTVGPGLKWTVQNGRFSGRKKETASGVTLYTTLEGRFTSANRAKGTIRQESIVAGSYCDTYKLKFSAKRG